MILYVGSDTTRQFTIKQGATELGQEFEFINANFRELSEIVDEVIAKNYPVVVIDVTDYKDNAMQIIESTDRIQKATTSRIFIQAYGFAPDSFLVQSFYMSGYSNFILASMPSFIIQEFIKCYSGEYEKLGASEEIIEASKKASAEKNRINTQEDIQLQQIKEAQKRHITIGVTGTRHFIGTTTQAMQLVKFFQYAGKTACLIEVLPEGESYFKAWMNNVDESDYTYLSELEKITANGIDIYCNSEKITKAIQKKYDYLVYDYGCYKENYFQSASYYDRDILVMVGGYKPNELASTTEFVIRSIENKIENMLYIFSFVPPSDKEALISSMEAVKDRIILPAYSPDIFAYNPENKYESIFDIDIETKTKKVEKKKFGFFRRGKKK